MQRLSYVPVIALLLSVAVPARAQTGPGWIPHVSAGTRVRATVIDSPRPPVIGAYGGATRDSMRVILTGTTSLSFYTPSLAHLDVSEGRERGRWAFIGGMVGAVGGGLIGAASMSGGDYAMTFEPLVGFFAGMVLGAPTGAIIGAIYAPERWTRYSNPR